MCGIHDTKELAGTSIQKKVSKTQRLSIGRAGKGAGGTVPAEVVERFKVHTEDGVPAQDTKVCLKD